MKKRIPITPEIRKAIVSLVEEFSTQTAVAEVTGVAQESIAGYISGKVKNMNVDTLEKLIPLLKKHLPKDFKNSGIIQAGNNNQAWGLTNRGGVIHLLKDSQELEEIKNSVIENFRNKLLKEIIKLDIDPIAKNEVLKTLMEL